MYDRGNYLSLLDIFFVYCALNTFLEVGHLSTKTTKISNYLEQPCGVFNALDNYFAQLSLQK